MDTSHLVWRQCRQRFPFDRLINIFWPFDSSHVVCANWPKRLPSTCQYHPGWPQVFGGEVERCWKMFEAKVLQLLEELSATFTDSKWEAEETPGNLRAFTAAMDACKSAKMLGWQSQEPENKLEVFASNILDFLEPWHILAFDNLQMISILALFIFIRSWAVKEMGTCVAALWTDIWTSRARLACLRCRDRKLCCGWTMDAGSLPPGEHGKIEDWSRCCPSNCSSNALLESYIYQKQVAFCIFLHLFAPVSFDCSLLMSFGQLKLDRILPRSHTRHW